jgi:hypothetical protein
MEALRKELEPRCLWSPALRNDLAAAYMNSGTANEAKPDVDGAIADYDRAIQLREALRNELRTLSQQHQDEFLEGYRRRWRNIAADRAEASRG